MQCGAVVKVMMLYSQAKAMLDSEPIVILLVTTQSKVLVPLLCLKCSRQREQLAQSSVLCHQPAAAHPRSPSALQIAAVVCKHPREAVLHFLGKLFEAGACLGEHSLL